MRSSDYDFCKPSAHLLQSGICSFKFVDVAVEVQKGLAVEDESVR
jgi:hypothetical protein